MSDHCGNILVVDDTPDNLRLLAAMLAEKGYKVRKALSGQIAINTIRQIPPDLVLLDINMPGIGGYEVCQILKHDPQTRDIPIIFISALDDVLDKVKAFQVGGSDYITKPFQGEEVCARIAHLLTIQRQKKQLQQEIADRHKAEEALQIYLHAVSHDLRNPVLGMGLVLETLRKQADPDAIALAVPMSTIEQMIRSCDRQLKLINSLIATQQYEVGGIALQCQPLSLYDFSQQAIADWQLICLQHEASLINNIPSDLPPVEADADQLWRVFDNLLGNAVKHNPPGITLTLSASTRSPESPHVRCSLHDDGIGLHEGDLQALFTRYGRGSGAGQTLGLGLGLYLCRQIVEAHGGQIGAETDPDRGTTFWFTLPRSEQSLSSIH